MKRFHIGDGEKTIECDDRYEGDGADGKTQTFTRADRPDVFVRATVITVTLKDGSPPDRLRIDCRDNAKKAGCAAVEHGEITYYIEEPKVTEDGDLIRFARATVENHRVLLSATYPDSLKGQGEERAIAEDLRVMVESLKVRQKGEASYGDLTVAHKAGIEEATAWLENFSGAKRDGDEWVEAMQSAVFALLDGRVERERTGSIGLVFGELLTRRVPGLRWHILVDDDGEAHALKYRETSITVFPTAMIWKRINRTEAFDVGELAEGAIDSIEGLFRKGC